MMINLTKRYLPKKTPILTNQQILKLLYGDVYDWRNNPLHLLFYVTICLMYFGLLRGCEVFQIDKDFLMFEDDGVITVNFSKGTKTRAKGFAFDIPASFREAFELYWSQIATEGEKITVRFLKNYKKSDSKRYLNSGQRLLTKILRFVEIKLGLTKGSLTSHTW